MALFKDNNVLRVSVTPGSVLKMRGWNGVSYPNIWPQHMVGNGRWHVDARSSRSWNHNLLMGWSHGHGIRLCLLRNNVLWYSPRNCGFLCRAMQVAALSSGTIVGRLGRRSPREWGRVILLPS
jgi:hypothetical protein